MSGPSQLRARLVARMERAAREGAGRTALQFAGFVATAFTWAALLPLSALLHLAGYRRLTVLTGHIGHLAAEPDAFLKARALGQVPPARYFLVAPPGAAANETLLEYWERHLPVVRGTLLGWFLLAMSRWVFLRYDMNAYVLRIGASQRIYAIHAAWDARPPLLTMTPEDREWSDGQFAALGLPPGAWFACVHVREPGFAPADEPAHAHRNADPRAVLPAMQSIASRGGWCIRMGDPTMTPLPPSDRVIDYAHHELRSARLDVLLCARARFFLGNTSGLAFVSAIFGVPSALANMIPLSVMGVLPSDLSIPKLLRDRATGRILTFSEILGSPAGNFRYAQLYAEAGLEPLENTPEEIQELAEEMLDRLEGYPVDDAGAAMQARFQALLRPGHYSFGTAARGCAAFLRRHRDLLAPELG